MKLTALEIKQQKFERSLRGYDPAEVQAFLKLTSNEWEHLAAKNRELQQQIDDLKEKLKHYERVEEALHETLQAAKESAETKLEGAQKEANSKIEKAELQAESIVREAKQQREHMQLSIRRLIDRRKEIAGGIRSYLEVARESVDQFDKDGEKLKNRLRKEKKKRSGNLNKSSTDTAGKKFTSTPPEAGSPINPPGTENIDDLVDDLE